MKINKIPINIKSLESSQFIIGRVTKVFNDPNDIETKEFFSSIYPGNSGIGAIEFELILNLNNINIGYAKPMFPNIKYYPLLNEPVLIIQGPSYKATENINNNELYYLSVYNVFNSSHINPIPITKNNQISNSNEINHEFGKTFNQQDLIQFLLSFEGDHIIEGRFGNSIRFGSTVSGSYTQSPWSKDGKSGEPITIIRNGQTYNEKNIDITLENVNTDASSIYFTKGQKIPIQVASKNMKSFGVTLKQDQTSSILLPNIEDNSNSYNNIGTNE